METITQAFNRLYNHIKENGYENSEANTVASYLFEDVLGIRIIHSSEHINEHQESQVQDIIKRVSNGEPWQYISGNINFYGLPFLINRHVLIPRPETEELVRISLQAIPKNKIMRILDVGTGSGVIAITLASKRPDCKVTGIDISSEALEVAQENKKKHTLSNVYFQAFDFLNTDLKELNSGFDVIISNPPYIVEEEKEVMTTSTLLFEPTIALFVRNDALEFYRRIAELALLQPSVVHIFTEVNEFKAKEVYALFVEKGFSDVQIIQDMQGLSLIHISEPTRPY